LHWAISSEVVKIAEGAWRFLRRSVMDKADKLEAVEALSLSIYW